LACVAKLAGSLGESMAWSGIVAATARQGRSKQRAEGVGEGRGGEEALRIGSGWKSVRGGDSTLPALPLRWRLPIGSRQGRETKKI
jgi:hypothetical protein